MKLQLEMALSLNLFFKVLPLNLHNLQLMFKSQRHMEKMRRLIKFNKYLRNQKKL